MSIVFSQLPFITEGQVLQQAFESTIEHLSTDSRQITMTKTTVFFAIKGRQHNGHVFIKDLYLRGIRQFVVEEGEFQSIHMLPEANVFQVKSGIRTLQGLATAHRQAATLPVLAITGSNGKTIVKEWLYQLLSPDFSIVKSPKSYNSQLGVPLSVWQIRPEHTLGIFEAGISKPDEMAALEQVIQPTFGIFTNIGPAHAEGFISLEQKIKEKALLFQHCAKIIYCKDHTSIGTHLEAQFSPEHLLSWAWEGNPTWRVSLQERGHRSIQVRIEHAEQSIALKLPFTDPASIENILHCVVYMLHLNVPSATIQSRLLGITNIPMRLELKAGRNNNYIIDDTYNNDPDGLKIALQFMQQQNMKGQKVVILSDMLETGLPSPLLYAKVAEQLHDKAITQFIGVGAEISKHKKFFPDNSLFYPDTDSLAKDLPQLHIHDALVLLKGARIFGFERLVQLLAQKIHRTVLEINLNALAHNLGVFRQMIQPRTKLMVMVKAFAYGSGSFEVAHLLQYHKVDYLAVAYTDEGIALRENNIHLPIMVMNPTADEFDKLVHYGLEPEIYSFAILHALLDHQKEMQVQGQAPMLVHLAIDTGMHRLGFEENDIEQLCTLLPTSPLKIASVFSHLVGADGAEHDTFSEKQALLFESIAKRIECALGYTTIKHLLNSPGITRFPQYEFDMVRLGIGLYGIESLGHPQNKHLQTVGTLKTIISQLRKVKKGETVGYSRKGLADQDLEIATLAIGYADGYARNLSNGVGKVWINGHYAPIIGNVCMDMCMADVTGTGAKEGDEVELFGPHISVNLLAEWSKTISYEILTSVSERVKRVFYLD